MTARWLGALALVAASFLPSRSSGQDQTPPSPPSSATQFQLPDPGDILPLHRGAPAPRDGLLIGAGDLLQIQQSYEHMRFLLGLTQERDAQVCDVRVQIEHAHTVAAEERLTLRDELWTARQAELVAQVMAAQQQAQRAGQRGIEESPALWAAIGAVVATAVFVAVSVH